MRQRMEKINMDYKGQNWQLKFAQTVTKTHSINTPYSKMAATLVFFCFLAN